MDDLMIGELKIYQNPQKYCFTTDAILLANFANPNKKTKAVDLGSGSGIIGILLVGKYFAQSCECVEIQDYFVQMSRKSIELNNLTDRIRVHNVALQKAHEEIGGGSFDLVVCNPPYSKKGDGNANVSQETSICRHEVLVTLDEVVESAKKLLKFGGRFCMVHQSERLGEIFSSMQKYGIEPKRLRFVQGKVNTNAGIVMIEGKLGAKKGLVVLPTLVLCNDDGTETIELAKIYSRI